MGRDGEMKRKKGDRPRPRRHADPVGRGGIDRKEE